MMNIDRETHNTNSVPTGTVTFLFTDIEGSTRRWETEPEAMRVALAVHDDVLRTSIERWGGWLFKHTGDGVCAAFASARSAVDAAIEAQHALELPVRMGVATGEVEHRGDDYYGPALNRAARVMGVGHGGQILLAASTAALISGIDLLDLGERRLRDLSGAQRLYQVRAKGLRMEFPSLRTLDGVPGNLRVQTTSFVGRNAEVTELSKAILAHRLVTLTGVGGVGKTRLALQVAAELVPEFPDGVWLIELGPIGDPRAVPSAVVTALGLAIQPGMSVTESVAAVLAGRRLLIVFDNCEHVLDAVADLLEAVLTRSNTMKALATSREGLRLPAEHLWPVPSLDMRDGVDSTAVSLFVERARSVVPGFELNGNADAVIEICRRLDGIALAIELAAARMVSMSPADVRDHLGDRFRLLAGSKRGLERHQTLRHAVQWSYDLLTADERGLLNCCSVFAAGFDLKAAIQVCGGRQLDEYMVLELLDSLVRKSLVTVDSSSGTARYALLETIRQFAGDQLAASEIGDETRDRHAFYFAGVARTMLNVWASPRQRLAHQWIDVELANLRTAFRRTVERQELETAATIAISAVIQGAFSQRHEPITWAEELLRDKRCLALRCARGIYMAASACFWLERTEDGVRYGEAGLALIDQPAYDPVTFGLDYLFLAAAQMLAGRLDKTLEVLATGGERSTDPTGMNRALMLWALGSMGRFDEAMAIADAVVAGAETAGVPHAITFALDAWGIAFAEADPVRALASKRRALAIARKNNIRLLEAVTARTLAGLEASHGDRQSGLKSFDDAIDFFHQTGDMGNLANTFGWLAVFFERIERLKPAATLYGTTTRDAFAMAAVPRLRAVADQLRTALGPAAFEEQSCKGAAMHRREAVQYAHTEIQHAREEFGESR